MSHWIELLVTVVCAVVASNGFWSFIQGRREKNDIKTKILVGLAHDRLMHLGTKYIERGWISHEEYNDLHKYLYKPYIDLGGNGSAAHVMEQVDQLPIQNHE